MTNVLDPNFRYEARFSAIEDRLGAIERDLGLVKERLMGIEGRLRALPDWRWYIAMIVTLISFQLAVGGFLLSAMNAQFAAVNAQFAALTFAMNQLAARVP
jgi:hypothetical protein